MEIIGKALLDQYSIHIMGLLLLVINSLAVFLVNSGKKYRIERAERERKEKEETLLRLDNFEKSLKGLDFSHRESCIETRDACRRERKDEQRLQWGKINEISERVSRLEGGK